MSLARTHSIALVGVEGHPVEIESDIENRLPGLLLAGLRDTALREARDRIRAAIINNGEQRPQRRITVGLSPASPKRDSGFDVSKPLPPLRAWRARSDRDPLAGSSLAAIDKGGRIRCRALLRRGTRQVNKQQPQAVLYQGPSSGLVS